MEFVEGGKQIDVLLHRFRQPRILCHNSHIANTRLKIVDRQKLFESKRSEEHHPLVAKLEYNVPSVIGKIRRRICQISIHIETICCGKDNVFSPKIAIFFSSDDKKIPENLGEKKFSGKIVIYVSDWKTRLIQAANWSNRITFITLANCHLRTTAIEV